MKRFCKVAIAEETVSAGEEHETAMWLQQVYFELTGVSLPIRLFVDSHGLQNNCKTTLLHLQKRLRIDMAALRKGLRRCEFVITWVLSRSNLLIL